MKKIFGLIAAAAFVGSAGFASAAEAPKAAESKELSTMEMDSVTAGVGSETTIALSSATRQIGRVTYKFDGSGWIRVR